MWPPGAAGEEAHTGAVPDRRNLQPDDDLGRSLVRVLTYSVPERPADTTCRPYG